MPTKNHRGVDHQQKLSSDDHPEAHQQEAQVDQVVARVAALPVPVVQVLHPVQALGPAHQGVVAVHRLKDQLIKRE